MSRAAGLCGRCARCVQRNRWARAARMTPAPRTAIARSGSKGEGPAACVHTRGLSLPRTNVDVLASPWDLVEASGSVGWSHVCVVASQVATGSRLKQGAAKAPTRAHLDISCRSCQCPLLPRARAAAGRAVATNRRWVGSMCAHHQTTTAVLRSVQQRLCACLSRVCDALSRRALRADGD